MNGRMLILGALVMGVFASMAYGHFTGGTTDEVENEPPAQMILSLEERERAAEAEIHFLINLEREAYGIEPLSYDDELAEIAAAHSNDMYDRNYFEYDTPDGIEPADRGKNAGYDCKISIPETNEYYDGIVENIFKKESTESLSLRGTNSIAKDAVDAWMGSNLHRGIILDNLLSVEGIGVKISENQILITQNFC